jgi:hypothetical protein
MHKSIALIIHSEEPNQIILDNRGKIGLRCLNLNAANP